MMQKNARRSSAMFYIYCYVCVLLTLFNEARCEAVNKEVLKEEHLLPVRVARAATENRFEGSGDDEVPITVLRSQVMERMTLARDNEEMEKASKIEGEAEKGNENKESREIVEDSNEGSGLNDKQPRITTMTNTTETRTKSSEIESWENDDEETTKWEEAEITAATEGSSDDDGIHAEVPTWKEKTTTILPVEEVKLESTVNDVETTKTATELTTVSEANLDATTAMEDENILNVHSEVTTDENEAEKQFSTIKYTEMTDIVKLEEKSETSIVKLEETTTVLPTEKSSDTKMEEKPQEVTEVIETKHLKPAFAVETVPEDKTETEMPETTATKSAIIIEATTEAIAIVENGNLTSETDPLHMKVNSRLLDSNDTVLLSSKEASRLGTYIVISLILLSFLSLIGFILMKKRVQRRRKQANLDQENLDTEKALLSLSEYKDHPDGIDEGKIRNNEITPIVIKSNSQINKFEKNTNFSSPKNLNTKANEKNVEKDNVLKKTSDNLTQVIIEDPTKDVEEEKSPTNAEKLIVRTHLDQDSIPKKPVIVNRTSLGCVPVSQD